MNKEYIHKYEIKCKTYITIQIMYRTKHPEITHFDLKRVRTGKNDFKNENDEEIMRIK